MTRTMTDFSRFFFNCVCIFLTVYPGILALKDVQIVLPPYVRQGLDVWLSCKYDLEKEALYAVKWYRGPDEFYRFLPKEIPPSKAFQFHGITVDVTLSNDRDVLLRNVSLGVSGTFKCVVAAEFPFQTLVASSDMTVVVIGDDGPTLELDRSQYHPGDRVSAECRSPPSYPPANITWYLDDILMADGYNKTDIYENKNELFKKSTVSRITFDLPEKVTPVGIKCRAAVFTVYDSITNTTLIKPVPRRLTGTETLLHSGTSTVQQISTSLLYTLLMIGCVLSKSNLCSNFVPAR